MGPGKDAATSDKSRVITGLVVTTAALYLAREILVPLALAILLSFLLAPLARRLERWGLGRIISVALVVLFAFGVLGLVGWAVTDQAISLAQKLPAYSDNVRQKLDSVLTTGQDIWQRGLQQFERLRGGTAGVERQPTPTPTQPTPSTALIPVVPPERPPPLQPTEDEPVPVRVVRPMSPLDMFRESFLVLVGPMATTLIVIVLVVFLLYQRQDLSHRVVRLMGVGRISITTQALDEISLRISRYLLMQLAINVTYGIPVGIGLYFLGIPNALLMGLLATVLRFLPYLGPWLAAAAPVALSIALFDDWWHFLGVVGLFVGLEVFVINLIEPWLYGWSIGASLLAIIFSAVFWTWLWGPVGLLLSTPLTMCLVVIGKRIPQLEFLNVLLSNEPALPPGYVLYQSLVSQDRSRVRQLIQEQLENASPVQVCDHMLIPALHLAEQDYHAALIDEDQHDGIFILFRELVDEVVRAARPDSCPKPSPPVSDETATIICIPLRDEADELASIMLAQVLREQCYTADSYSIEYATGELLVELEKAPPKVVVISALPPVSLKYARLLTKRLRVRWPGQAIITGLWDELPKDQVVKAWKHSLENVRVVTSYQACLVELGRLLGKAG